jgi:hypothetical protein
MDLPDKSKPATPQPEPKHVPKAVVTGAVPVKRPATRRFLDYVFAESPKQIAQKVATQTVVPRLKLSAYEAFEGFIRGMFLGGVAKPLSGFQSPTPFQPGSGINYAGVTSGQTPLQQAQQANMARPNVGNYRDLTLPTMEKAEFLYANLIQVHNKYRVVTVADLWEMAGLTPEPSMNHYGWRTLENAQIATSAQGYVLRMPPPILV